MDVVAKLRSIYTNIMRIDYDNTRTRSENIISACDTEGSKTPDVLFADLYALQSNTDMSDEQQQYINSLIDEIWSD